MADQDNKNDDKILGFDRNKLLGLISAAIAAIVTVVVVTNKSEINADNNSGNIVGNVGGDFNATTTINNNESYEQQRAREANALKSALLTKCQTLIDYAKDESGNLDFQTPQEAFSYAKIREADVINFFGQDAFSAIQAKALALRPDFEKIIAGKYLMSAASNNMYGTNETFGGKAMEMAAEKQRAEVVALRDKFISDVNSLCNDYQALTLQPAK